MLPPKDGIIDPAQDAARLTPFGKKLRSTRLDELSELINVIKVIWLWLGQDRYSSSIYLVTMLFKHGGMR